VPFIRELEEDDESYFGESYYSEDQDEMGEEGPGAYSVDQGILGQEFYDDRNNIEIH
jgi:Ca2+/Na+ antiporter